MQILKFSTALLIALFCIALISFQNCGKKSGKSIDQAVIESTAAFGGSHGPHRAREILVKSKTAVAHQVFINWAIGQGLVRQDTYDSAHRLTHWSWTADVSAIEMQDMISKLDLADDVEYAEPNYFLSSPDDKDNINLGLSVPNTAFQTSADINLAAARGALTSPSAGNTPIIVGVIDSGVDLDHPALKDALWKNNAGESGYNFINGNNNPDDFGGHGTHCAGIVLGVGEDISQGFTGQYVKIMALKFLADDGGLTSNAISAIFYGVDNGAQVLSNSWGGGSSSRSLNDAIAYAYNNDVVFIAAAGNSSNNNDNSPTYPASYEVPHVLSIAATTDNDLLASFSNFGATSVDMAAPGVRILSTYNNGDYAYLSGTSMATPFVSGTAALMLYENPQLNAFQIKNILMASSQDVSALNGKVVGHNRLDVDLAISTAKSTLGNDDKPTYEFANFSTNFGGGSASGSGGGCGLVTKTNGPSGPSGPVSALFLVPFLLIIILRSKDSLVGKA